MQQASSSRAPKTAGDLIRNLQLHRYLGTEETEETRRCQGLTLGGKSQSCRVSCIVYRVSCIVYLSILHSNKDSSKKKNRTTVRALVYWTR